MTGYTVHTGANQKYTEGWDRVFKKAGTKRATAAPAKSKKPVTKKSRGK